MPCCSSHNLPKTSKHWQLTSGIKQPLHKPLYEAVDLTTIWERSESAKIKHWNDTPKPLWLPTCSNYALKQSPSCWCLCPFNLLLQANHSGREPHEFSLSLSLVNFGVVHRGLKDQLHKKCNKHQQRAKDQRNIRPIAYCESPCNIKMIEHAIRVGIRSALV